MNSRIPDRDLVQIFVRLQQNRSGISLDLIPVPHATENTKSSKPNLKGCLGSSFKRASAMPATAVVTSF